MLHSYTQDKVHVTEWYDSDMPKAYGYSLLWNVPGSGKLHSKTGSFYDREERDAAVKDALWRIRVAGDERLQRALREETRDHKETISRPKSIQSDYKRGRWW